MKTETLISDAVCQGFMDIKSMKSDYFVRGSWTMNRWHRNPDKWGCLSLVHGHGNPDKWGWNWL